jgi:hypothetical protein
MTDDQHAFHHYETQAAPPPSALSGLLSVAVVLALLVGGLAVVVAVLSVLYPMSFWVAVGVGAALGFLAAPLLAFRAGAPLKEKPGWRFLRWPLSLLVGCLFQAGVVGAVWEFGGRTLDDFLFTAEHAAYVILDGSDFGKAAEKRFDPPEASTTAPPDGATDGGPGGEEADGGVSAGDGGTATHVDGGGKAVTAQFDGGPGGEAKPKKERKRRKVTKLPRGLPTGALYVNYTGFGQIALDLEKSEFDVAKKQMRGVGSHRELFTDKGKSRVALKWSQDKIWSVAYEPLVKSKPKKRRAASKAIHDYMRKAFGEPDDERVIPSGTRLRWESGDRAVVLYLPTPKKGRPDGIHSDGPWVIMTNNYETHRKTREKGF